MISKTYLIYDYEPVKRLIDVPVTFIPLVLVFILIFRILPNQIVTSNIFMYASIILFMLALYILSSLWAKHISSNKIEILLTSDYLEISFLRKKRKNNNLRIYLKEIIKTEDIDNNLGIADHFKIYYGDNKLFAISKSTHFFLLKDNFEDFKKDLKKELTNKN